jgi:hypothetical protein
MKKKQNHGEQNHQQRDKSQNTEEKPIPVANGTNDFVPHYFVS